MQRCGGCALQEGWRGCRDSHEFRPSLAISTSADCPALPAIDQQGPAKRGVSQVRSRPSTLGSARQAPRVYSLAGRAAHRRRRRPASSLGGGRTQRAAQVAAWLFNLLGVFGKVLLTVLLACGQLASGRPSRTETQPRRPACSRPRRRTKSSAG